jgi:hypothetical protein
MNERLIVWCRVFAVVVLAIVGGGCNVREQSDQMGQPQPAVEAVLAAFDKYPVVAIGEVHWLLEQHQFFHTLIRHPNFANVVNDIVIEWGNARHQATLDRYIAGENVPVADLRAIWRDHSASPIGPWDAEVYEEFFTVVRDVNAHLPTERRLRVLAGDPPVDWNRSEAERLRLTRERDKHVADIVEQEVLAKGRKALVLIGTMHIRRGLQPNPTAPFAPEFAVANVTKRLEASHPGSVYVILPHDGVAGNPDPSIRQGLEQAMQPWPKPSITVLKNTIIGTTEAKHFISPPLVLGAPEGHTLSNPVSVDGLTLADLGDAYLYLGPLDSLTASRVAPHNFTDQPYLDELSRRQGGRPFATSVWRRENESFAKAMNP